MAVLESIRVKLGVFISVVIALALLSFIIDPTTLQNVASSMSSKYNVGEINGKKITYNDFHEQVESYSLIQEMISGSSSQSEKAQEQVRNAVWQSLIDQNLFLKNAGAAGLNVGMAEILDLTSGEMVSPIIAQNPVFCDENGYFSTDALVAFVQNIAYDQSGNLKLYWDYLQNAIYTQQYYSKYGSLFTASSYTNPLMLEKLVAENNNTTDVDFVLVPFGYAKDTTIVVSPNEIKSYYKAHKEQYKQTASRDVEYVVFEVKPSDDDIASATVQANALHDEFGASDNVKSFLLKNSDRQLSEYYYKAGELKTVNTDVDKFVAEAKAGELSPLYKKNNTFYAAKVLEVKMLPDSAYVRHILLQGTDEALADSLVTVLKKKGASFANLAAQYSADQNVNTPERGDIGWMTQTYMIPGMESVLSAKVGEIMILDTQYGKHIVEVTKKTSAIEKKQVAIFERAILPSKATYNEYYSKANTLASAANGKYENFKAAVSEQGLYAHPVNKMLESNSKLGSVSGTKEVTRWAFEAKKGAVSNIITINNNYFFVAAVKDIHKEGYATIEEASSHIQNAIYAEKLAAKKLAEVNEKIEGLGSLEAIADALETSVSSSDNITFASLTSQGLDPKFIGAVSVSPEGEIKSVAGSNGIYVYSVKAHDTGAFFTEDDAATRKAQENQYNSQILLSVIIDDANVVDNRARFF